MEGRTGDLLHLLVLRVLPMWVLPLRFSVLCPCWWFRYYSFTGFTDRLCEPSVALVQLPLFIACSRRNYSQARDAETALRSAGTREGHLALNVSCRYLSICLRRARAWQADRPLPPIVRDELGAQRCRA